MWPFVRRSGPRAQTDGATSATELALQALDAAARGRPVDASSLALAESCVSQWEKALASATVGPESMALSPCTPTMLALVGRSLATSGNCLFAIDVSRGGVALHPASSWDPRGGYRPDSRRYYVTMSGPEGTATRHLPADSVLHFRIGASDSEHWRGRAPLYRARSTAAVASRLEAQMLAEAKIPVSRFVPLSLPGAGSDAAQDVPEAVKKGGVHVIPTGHGHGGEQMPSQRYAPQRMGMHPAETVPDLRSAVGLEICAAFGVPAALIIANSDGSAQRESARRFWNSTVAGLGRIIEAELAAKLDSRATVGFPALATIDEDVQSRAISRRAAAFKTFTDAGIPRAEALRLSGIEG